MEISSSSAFILRGQSSFDYSSIGLLNKRRRKLLSTRAVTEIERCRNVRNMSPIEIDLTTDEISPKIINEVDSRVDDVNIGVQGRRILKAMRRRLKSQKQPQDIVLVPDDNE